MRTAIVTLFVVGVARIDPIFAKDVTPISVKDDPRVQTVAFHQDRRVRIAMAPGGDVTIILGAGERIADIKLSDYARYQATLSQVRDGLLLHANPVRASLAIPTEATMHLTSDRHDYNFVMTLAPADVVTASVLRFTYVGKAAHGTGSAVTATQYRLSGSREVRPSMIRDDGAKMYLQWPATAPMPAVFAIVHGREEMVNGAQRDSLFTIDRIFAHLVFRIDKLQAQADRRSGTGL